MDDLIASGNLEGHSDKSHADLVDPGDVPLQREDIQGHANPGEHLEEGNGDEKGRIPLLPFELMDQTFAQLPFVERTTTTSLVYKKFRDVNRSHIYKYIHMHLGKQPKERGPDHRNPGLEEFGQFFTTLLRQDHLRDRVVSLAFTVHHHDLYLQVQGHLENLLKHLKFLKELSLNPPPSRFDFATNPATTFLRLDFHYHRPPFWQPFPTIPLLELTQFFHINHIRKLQIEHVSFAPSFHRDPFTPRQQRTSLISNLQFIACSPQTIGNLPSLLLPPRSLQTFVLETHCPRSVAQTPHARPHTMTAQQLHQALEPHAPSLQQLILAFSDGAGFKANSTTISLQDWTNLTRLAIPEAFLVSSKPSDDDDMLTPLHDVLPPRLKELQLQYPVGKGPGSSRRHDVWTTSQALIMRRLTQLAQNKVAFLPDLTLLVVWRQGRDEDDVEATAATAGTGVVEQLDMLQSLFMSVGTAFDLCVGEAFAETKLGRMVGVKGRGGGRGGNVSAYTLDEEGEGGGAGLYFDEDLGDVF